MSRPIGFRLPEDPAPTTSPTVPPTVELESSREPAREPSAAYLVAMPALMIAGGLAAEAGAVWLAGGLMAAAVFIAAAAGGEVAS